MQEFYAAGIARSNHTGQSLQHIVDGWERPFKTFRFNGKQTRLYYHRTDGGAEYLMDAHNSTGEGIVEGSTVLVRIDGNELEIVRLPKVGLK